MSNEEAVAVATAARAKADNLKRARVALTTRLNMREAAHPGNAGLRARAVSEDDAAERLVARAERRAEDLEVAAGVRVRRDDASPTADAPPAGETTPLAGETTPPAGETTPPTADSAAGGNPLSGGRGAPVSG